jgi:hypothetical protein
MIFKKLLLPTVVLCAAANAGAIFNFDGDSLGTATGFTDTANGISATFSSAADPGGFVVYASMFETLTGNVLGDPGPAEQDGLNLNISFSQDLQAITLDFATDDFITPSPFTITAFENSTQVGTATSTGEFLSGFTFPEGEITFAGGPFNQVVLSSTAMDFAVDNINVIAAPEPGTFALLGASLLLTSLAFMRRRNAARR